MTIRTRENGRAAPAASPTPATPGLLRSINDRVVLDLLLEHKTLSRGDVRQLTGVSKPTASQLLTRLEESGHVIQSGYSENSQGGRASAVYELNPRSGFAAAINVTPTRVHAQVANVLGTVIGEHHETVERDADGSGPDRAIDTLRIALDAAGIHLAELSSIVVAAPGSYDPEADLLRYAGHLSAWQDAGIVQRMQETTGVPVHIENDVNLVAVAEQSVGTVRDSDSFFLFWVDERIGGALMIGDRLYRGSNGGAGEVAFLQLPGVPVVHHPVRENRGGFEDLAGEAQIVQLGASHGFVADDAVGVVSAAVTAAGDASEAFLAELSARYAIGLASVIALLDPGIIVLAGAIMVAGGDRLREHISAQVEDVAISGPPLALGEVRTDPVIAGALLVSLEHTRNDVFST